MFAWSSRFKSLFAIVQETLFIQYEAKGMLLYMMPVGKMKIDKSLNLLRDDANELNIPLKIKVVSEDLWAEINDLMPNQFIFSLERENYEYIYLTENLINLSGKKLQSKRNHINRFKAENPDWAFNLIQKREDYYDCWNLLKAWEDERINAGGNHQQSDIQECKSMLRNFEELQLQGGMIRVNGKIVAFAIGEPLTADTFVVHIEKANANITGAYAIINQQLAEHIASNYTYINREEDMGLESLRKAKLSYQPSILLTEGALTYK